jgi:ribosomal-protein-alanine N-acetyltransferase
MPERLDLGAGSEVEPRRAWGIGSKLNSFHYLDICEDFDIREAAPEDIGALAALEALCFSLPWSSDDFAVEILENELAFYLVCASERGILAYAGLWAVLNEGHIMNLAVHPDFRGRGLGAVLLGELLDRAGAELGLVDFTLEVRAANMAAIRLYERFGFREEGRRREYYSAPREDAVIMWRRGLDERGPARDPASA